MFGLRHLAAQIFSDRSETSRGPIRLWIERLRDSFWFVPSLFAAAAITLGLTMPYVDHLLGSDDTQSPLGFTFDAGAGGARAMLQSIAGGSMTVMATVFSITIATLALTSSQFGPRLLRTFVTDRGIQMSMGTFIATYLYSMLLLRTVRTAEEDVVGSGFVPHLGTTLAMLLALASVGVIIYFVHHLALLIRAPHVVDTVGNELDDALDSVLPEGTRDDAGSTASVPDLPRGPDRTVVARADVCGYISFIEEGTLAAMAQKREATLWLAVSTGDYVYDRTPLAVTNNSGGDAFGPDDLKEIVGAIHVGDRRTLTGDPWFGIDQLTEIAQRAMSPGINDPFTCCSCVDRLGAALSRVAGRAMPDVVTLRDVKDGDTSEGDDDAEVSTTGRGDVRLVARRPTWDGLIARAYDPIRRYSSKDAAVLGRLLGALTRLAAVAPPDRQAVLVEQADAVLAAAEASGMDKLDLRSVRTAHGLFAAGQTPPIDDPRKSPVSA